MARQTAAGSIWRFTFLVALSAVCLTSTALAANSSSLICDKTAEPVRDTVVDEITASPAAHDRDFAPHAEALIKQAFDSDVDDVIDADRAEGTSEDAEAEVTVALPGVSDEQIRLYREQMYRTDI